MKKSLPKKIKARRLEPTAPIEKLGYSRKEAALALGIGPTSIDTLRERGLLHPSVALSKPIYSKPDMLAFLANTTGQLIDTE
jgi:hypothetical protein